MLKIQNTNNECGVRLGYRQKVAALQSASSAIECADPYVAISCVAR